MGWESATLHMAARLTVFGMFCCAMLAAEGGCLVYSRPVLASKCCSVQL